MHHLLVPIIGTYHSCGSNLNAGGTCNGGGIGGDVIGGMIVLAIVVLVGFSIWFRRGRK